MKLTIFKSRYQFKRLNYLTDHVIISFTNFKSRKNMQLVFNSLKISKSWNKFHNPHSNNYSAFEFKSSRIVLKKHNRSYFSLSSSFTPLSLFLYNFQHLQHKEILYIWNVYVIIISLIMQTLLAPQQYVICVINKKHYDNNIYL